ncbi:MAG: SHOCT domain-containing protein [Phycisphaerales bacterium]|nr:SHOCT domain-containing protein [Phycisphaerales bacterium]
MIATQADSAAGAGLAEASVDMTAMWLAIGGLLAAALVGALLIHAVRRHFNRQHDASGDVFTLNDLRRLHREGQLSDEEYERLRDQLLGLASGRATQKTNKASEPSRQEESA